MSSSTFHLLPERVHGSPLSPVVVPPTISAYSIDAGRLAPVSGPKADAALMFLEPLIREKPPRLLFIDRGSHDVRVNGQRVPEIFLLNVGDQLRIGAGDSMEVALYQKIKIGPPLPESIGQTCPVCLTKIEEDSRVYHCPSCGMALHLEENSQDEEALDCAKSVPACHRCRTVIQLGDCYPVQPDFLSDEAS